MISNVKRLISFSQREEIKKKGGEKKGKSCHARMSRVFRESLERELPLYRRIGCPSLAQFSSCVGPWQRDYSFLFYVLSILCPFSLSRISILVFFFLCVCGFI